MLITCYSATVIQTITAAVPVARRSASGRTGVQFIIVRSIRQYTVDSTVLDDDQHQADQPDDVVRVALISDIE